MSQWERSYWILWLLCFVGDSLGRQLHVEVACKHGHSHKWWPSNTSGGKRVVAPSHSTLLSGAQLRYSALFCHLTPQLPEEAGHLKAQLGGAQLYDDRPSIPKGRRLS